MPSIFLKEMARQAAHGGLDDTEFRARMARFIAFADVDSFRRECLRYPLLGQYCQVVLDEAATRLTRCRRQASRLLEKGPDVKRLKALDKECLVLGKVLAILGVASERAMGPTPDGDVNVLLKLAKARNFAGLRFGCRSYRDALLSGPKEPWMAQHLAALARVLQALRLKTLGDRADRPHDLKGALAELIRAAEAMPVYEGPPPCQNPPPRDPLSSIWRMDVCEFRISRVFPEWPWWWIWPTRELPRQLSVQ